MTASKEAVFDGMWRLKKSGQFIDARNLPAEPPADENDAEAMAARKRLQGILEDLREVSK